MSHTKHGVCSIPESLANIDMKCINCFPGVLHGLSNGVGMQVDYTGFSTINVQRFGQRYVGKVANPHDMLLWQKAPARKPKVCQLTSDF